MQSYQSRKNMDPPLTFENSDDSLVQSLSNIHFNFCAVSGVCEWHPGSREQNTEGIGDFIEKVEYVIFKLGIRADKYYRFIVTINE